MSDDYLEGIMNKGEPEMNNENLKDVPHPICPLNMFFEGDEDRCDTSKCDFGEDRSRSCTGACKRHKKKFEKHLLEDDKAILPGSGISYHQFEKPDYQILKTFDNPKIGPPFTVKFSTKELTSLCPLTGFPDFYQIEISYIPNRYCVESKSAKFYFHSFRDAGMFIETLTNRIADDWQRACDPMHLEVEVTMNARGGIPITVEVERHKRS